MDFMAITHVVKEVTGLHEVPVYFNDMEANCKGSPYFGVGEHCWEIADEELLDHPMFELVDFIENKHLRFYHVGLPEKIIDQDDDYVFKVVGEQFKEKGIKLQLDERLMEVFIILHEFGHAHELFVSYQGDVEKYLSETTEENRTASYHIRAYGLGGTEEGLRVHKSTATEKYADEFALQYIERVAEKAKKQELLHF